MSHKYIWDLLLLPQVGGLSLKLMGLGFKSALASWRWILKSWGPGLGWPLGRGWHFPLTLQERALVNLTP